ncbi:FCS-Like Zinc finger 2-like [Miscanthus floridulus]|uniref:FCS-Like Zinc finger 2-like n=1 Tax=Miscanthus floridulus TaxID=154761 RepID=UPI003458410C
MLPRRQSIFHLGEEGGAGASAVHHRVSVVGASSSMAMGGRRAREREPLVVGLQILVHHYHHHHGRHGHAHAHAANVVLKQMVRPRAVAAAGSRHGHGGHAFSCSFLKACFLCKRELSPDKDVYMYKGDQGFCSEECRWQQILVDEAREREAAALMSKQDRHHSPHPTPIRGRPPPRKTLAVA